MIEAALLERIWGRYGLAEQYREQEPALLWAQIGGPKIAKMTEPLYVQNGVLFVAVPSHVIQHEFTLMREEFRRKLNTALGAEHLREVRFQVKVPPKPKASPIPSLAQIPLTPQEEREIEELASVIEDAPLRQTLAQLMKTAKRIERARRELGWQPCPRCGTLCAERFCPLCAQETL